MIATERRGRLTYERLINSLERYRDVVTSQLPELKNAERIRDLQLAINFALTAAHAGMSGALVASPAQLKRDLKAQIANIHARCDVVDKAPVQACDSAVQINACTSSASGGNHVSSPSLPHQISEPKCAHSICEGSKENVVLPTTSVPQPATRRVSAVRMTPIIKRAASSKSPTNPGTKKHSDRKIRSKTSTQDPITTSLPAPHDAELAAAGALIELKRSPETSSPHLASSISSTSFVTPSANVNKRDYSFYKDGTSSPYLPQSQEPASSSPTPERRMLALNKYAEVPELAKGLSRSEAFALGVEYAVQHLPANLRADGEEMRGWVEEQLGLQMPSPSIIASMCVSNSDNGMASSPVDTKASYSTISGGKRGFWDIV